MVEAVVRAKFREGRGSRLVKQNQWQLLDTRNTHRQITSERWEFVPGLKITMALVLPQVATRMQCPRPGCASISYTEALGGGYNWLVDMLSSFVPC